MEIILLKNRKIKVEFGEIAINPNDVDSIRKELRDYFWLEATDRKIGDKNIFILTMDMSKDRDIE